MGVSPARAGHSRRPLLAVGVVVAALFVAPGAQAAEFNPTGGERTYTVPAGVYSVHVVATGGRGGTPTGGGTGGVAATVTSNLAVTPGEVLYVDVGGDANGAGNGGFNGGGNGGVNGGGGG